MEEKQLMVEAKLIKRCTVEELFKVAEKLEMPENTWKEQTHDVVFRRIQAVFDEIADPTERYQKMLSLIGVVPGEMAESLMEILSNKPKVEPTEDSRHQSIQDMLVLLKSMGIDTSKTSTLRREFKIAGVIGDKLKDHLTYISLCCQIAEGRKKGYSEEEIALAIRKAVAPGTNLRTYLDSKIDLPLENVISFIRSYLKEKSATELFQDLNNICQLDSEDAQSFVLRAMELREKVLMASEAEGALKYDSELVQSLFLHTVRTGISDDAVKARIEPLIKKESKTSDEVLVQELNIAASEKLRKQKSSTTRITLKTI